MSNPGRVILLICADEDLEASWRFLLRQHRNSSRYRLNIVLTPPDIALAPQPIDIALILAPTKTEGIEIGNKFEPAIEVVMKFDKNTYAPQPTRSMRIFGPDCTRSDVLEGIRDVMVRKRGPKPVQVPTQAEHEKKSVDRMMQLATGRIRDTEMAG